MGGQGCSWCGQSYSNEAMINNGVCAHCILKNALTDLESERDAAKEKSEWLITACRMVVLHFKGRGDDIPALNACRAVLQDQCGLSIQDIEDGVA